MLAFFDAALDGFVVYDNIFDIIDRYLKQLNLDGTPVVVFGVALILVGMFLLAIAILGGIYRKGISKAVKCAVKAETSDRTEIRISSFSIGFGYVIGVLLMLNSLTFTGTDLLKLPFAYDPEHRAFAIYLISLRFQSLHILHSVSSDLPVLPLPFKSKVPAFKGYFRHCDKRHDRRRTLQSLRCGDTGRFCLLQ